MWHSVHEPTAHCSVTGFAAFAPGTPVNQPAISYRPYVPQERERRIVKARSAVRARQMAYYRRFSSPRHPRRLGRVGGGRRENGICDVYAGGWLKRPRAAHVFNRFMFSSRCAAGGSGSVVVRQRPPVTSFADASQQEKACLQVKEMCDMFEPVAMPRKVQPERTTNR